MSCFDLVADPSGSANLSGSGYPAPKEYTHFSILEMEE